ncbi:hypothetical protein Kpol_316p2 [Vanderwaltozyma polyspora DSM 70294]|uniref:Uncharacterized protein n=1 Tax=Vanderwaltozyma polyspora (strain ATCC 22028 / DSM 70294 / BCRC 21397 / CBS 2163 / NBRC 10782 / NRRL Y-8283 / UCD 57-17) TaxID=436907 RepID=A7TSP2_VANPO|nr:uncharacterized protein Kpol_316p2 [Vanderwaltozyma polyspora DSM 70294]EDO14709.1 hypothetical protein Kpol_316p2 [Vanderwaltozyma polyspora DSM 70294]
MTEQTVPAKLSLPKIRIIDQNSNSIDLSSPTDSSPTDTSPTDSLNIKDDVHLILNHKRHKHHHHHHHRNHRNADNNDTIIFDENVFSDSDDPLSESNTTQEQIPNINYTYDTNYFKPADPIKEDVGASNTGKFSDTMFKETNRRRSTRRKSSISSRRPTITSTTAATVAAAAASTSKPNENILTKDLNPEDNTMLKKLANLEDNRNIHGIEAKDFGNSMNFNKKSLVTQFLKSFNTSQKPLPTQESSKCFLNLVKRSSAVSSHSHIAPVSSLHSDYADAEILDIINSKNYRSADKDETLTQLMVEDLELDRSKSQDSTISRRSDLSREDSYLSHASSRTSIMSSDNESGLYLMASRKLGKQGSTTSNYDATSAIERYTNSVRRKRSNTMDQNYCEHRFNLYLNELDYFNDHIASVLHDVEHFLKNIFKNCLLTCEADIEESTADFDFLNNSIIEFKKQLEVLREVTEKDYNDQLNCTLDSSHLSTIILKIRDSIQTDLKQLELLEIKLKDYSQQSTKQRERLRKMEQIQKIQASFIEEQKQRNFYYKYSYALYDFTFITAIVIVAAFLYCLLCK